MPEFVNVVNEDDVWNAGLNNGRPDKGPMPLRRSTTECNVERDEKFGWGVRNSGNVGKLNVEGAEDRDKKVETPVVAIDDEIELYVEVLAALEAEDINDNLSLSAVKDFETNSVNCSISLLLHWISIKNRSLDHRFTNIMFISLYNLFEINVQNVLFYYETVSLDCMHWMGK